MQDNHKPSLPTSNPGQFQGGKDASSQPGKTQAVPGGSKPTDQVPQGELGGGLAQSQSSQSTPPSQSSVGPETLTQTPENTQVGNVAQAVQNQSPVGNENPESALQGGQSFQEQGQQPMTPAPTGLQTENNPEGLGMADAPFKKPFPTKTVLVIAAVIIAIGLIIALILRFRQARSGGTFGKKGEIIWWGLQLDEDFVKPLLEDYQKENPKTKITYVKQSSQDYRERLTSALASGKGPDIFEIHNSWPIMFMNELAVLPSSIMTPAEFSQTFYPVITSDLTTSKGIVGIPLEFDALTLFVNEDLFASAAKQPPKTWDELRDLVDSQKPGSLTILGGNEIVQSGVALGITSNVDHWQEIVALMMLQNGASLARPSGERAKAALDYYLQFTVSKAWNSTLPPSTTQFARGNLAMYFGPTKRAFDILEISPDIKFRTVALPQLPKDAPNDPDVSYTTYWAQGVWDRSTNKEESWKLLKYLSSHDSLTKLNTNIRLETGVERLSPRLDSINRLLKDPILGSVVSLGISAKSWYLVGETYDGPTGINSQINSLYKKVIGNKGGRVSPKVLEETASQVSALLSQYGTK